MNLNSSRCSENGNLFSLQFSLANREKNYFFYSKANRNDNVTEQKRLSLNPTVLLSDYLHTEYEYLRWKNRINTL